MKTPKHFITEKDGIKFLHVGDRVIWIPSGGEGDGGEGDPPKPDSKPAGEAKFTQEDLNRIAADEKREGKRVGQAELLKTLGFGTPEEAQAFLDAKRQADLDAMTEADRKVAEAADKERKAQEATATAEATVHTAKIERALERAGVPADSSAEVRALVTAPTSITEEELEATVTSLKTKFPALFSGTVTTPKPANGDTGNGNGNGDGNRPTAAESKTEAEKLLLERHPEIVEQRAARAAQAARS